jgi:hypothetical protein
MNNIVNLIPSTTDELIKNTRSFKTKSEQIEYLADIKHVFERDRSQDENKDTEYTSSEKNKIIKYAEKEINNLGGKPEKWIEYTLVTNITDYNEIKRRMKEEGRLNGWVEWMLSNLEPSEKEHIGIKEILGWRYNDSVIRQARLDYIEQDKEYAELSWNALNLDDEFVEHLKRQLNKEDLNISRVVSPMKYFADNNFHELVLRTMKKVGTNWNIVKNNLSKETLEGESVKIRKVSNHEGEMRPQILFSTKDYIEPYKVMESTFKKKLTHYRKHLRKLPLPGND